MKFDPQDDGITHINIYSKAKTTLGRLLSNFACTPFEHPLDGRFSSIEGYWYWLKIQIGHSYDNFPPEQELNELRILHGYKAKQHGQDLLNKYKNEMSWNAAYEKAFRVQIKQSFLAKISHSKSLEGMIVVSELPFTHYYCFGSKVIEPKQYNWQVEFWEKLREGLKKHESGGHS
jgi:hypothetical protein